MYLARFQHSVRNSWSKGDESVRGIFRELELRLYRPTDIFTTREKSYGIARAKNFLHPSGDVAHPRVLYASGSIDRSSSSGYNNASNTVVGSLLSHAQFNRGYRLLVYVHSVMYYPPCLAYIVPRRLVLVIFTGSKGYRCRSSFYL